MMLPARPRSASLALGLLLVDHRDDEPRKEPEPRREQRRDAVHDVIRPLDGVRLLAVTVRAMQTHLTGPHDAILAELTP